MARYGGDEFVVVLPHTGREGALATGERFRAAIAAAAWAGRAVTASVGAATLTAAMLSPSELLAEADRALYHSKRGGRNRVTHGQDLAEPAAPKARG